MPDVTDLQCPATAVLLDGAVPPPSWLARLPVAGRFDAADRRAVVELVDGTADLYRGEAFVVSAPADAIGEALGSRGITASAPIVIEVDSDGWRRAPQP